MSVHPLKLCREFVSRVTNYLYWSSIVIVRAVIDCGSYIVSIDIFFIVRIIALTMRTVLVHAVKGIALGLLHGQNAAAAHCVTREGCCTVILRFDHPLPQADTFLALSRSASRCYFGGLAFC